MATWGKNKIILKAILQITVNGTFTQAYDSKNYTFWLTDLLHKLADLFLMNFCHYSNSKTPFGATKEPARG